MKDLIGLPMTVAYWVCYFLFGCVTRESAFR